jgi:hypothetical protein
MPLLPEEDLSVIGHTVVVMRVLHLQMTQIHLNQQVQKFNTEFVISDPA